MDVVCPPDQPSQYQLALVIGMVMNSSHPASVISLTDLPRACQPFFETAMGWMEYS